MPGMQTQLNAVINKPGDYLGQAAHYSGYGFSHMRFRFHGLSDDEFAEWVNKAKAGGQDLTRDKLRELMVPTQERTPPAFYASYDADLYERILNRCVNDNQVCMPQIMALDASRSRRLPFGDASCVAAVEGGVIGSDEKNPLARWSRSGQKPPAASFAAAERKPSL